MIEINEQFNKIEQLIGKELISINMDVMKAVWNAAIEILIKLTNYTYNGVITSEELKDLKVK